MRCFYSLAVAVLAVFSVVAPARADLLELMNGDVLIGELISQERRSLKFRYQYKGVWATRTFTRAQYDRVTEEPGDQSDLGAAAAEENMDTPAGRFVAVIPLTGTVGRHRGGEYFSAEALGRAIEVAQTDGAEFIILPIDSPGGLVSEMEAICELLLDVQDDTRIVAFPKDALSAAAIITLSCREVMVHPDARIGAAVIIRTGGGKVDAVEAKFASPHYARQRQYMARSGHPYALIAAMTIQSKSLWYSEEDDRFTTDTPADSADWIQLDDEESIFTMTAGEALGWKVARGEAESASEVLIELGTDAAVRIRDYSEVMAKENRRFEQRVTRLIDEFESYIDLLNALNRSLVQLAEAINSGDRRAVDRAHSACTRALSGATTARRKVATFERTLLGQRFKEPGLVVNRMKADDKLMRNLARSLQSRDAAGFNKAVESWIVVVDAWNALLSG